MDAAEFAKHKAAVDTPAGRIAYAEVGAGPPALFVHGVFTNSLLWRNLVERLGSLRRCLAVDLPSHGDSPSEARQDLSLEGQADALAGFCDTLGLGRIDLVGNDTGGAVAQIFAARYPDRLASLVLTNCDAHDNFPPAAFEAGVEMARSGKLSGFVEAMVADLDLARSEVGLGLGYERPDLLPDEVVLGYLAPLVATAERGAEFERFVTTSTAEMLLVAEPALRRLEVPTLVAWGSGDVFFEMAWARWLAETIPGAGEPVEITGAKLFFVDERADELAPHVVGLWRSTRR